MIVVAAAATHVHAAAPSLRAFAGVTRIFECRPAFFKKDTLLRIHADRLHPGDLEEGGVEQIDALQESSIATVSKRFRSKLRWQITGEIPARNLAHGIDACGEVLPQLGQIRRHCEATTHPDDRNRVFSATARHYSEMLGRFVRACKGRRGRGGDRTW